MPQTNNHQYKISLIIFLAAMAIRILFLYLNYGPIAKIPSSAIAAPDGYLTVAESLLAGQGFSQHSASIPFTFPAQPASARVPRHAGGAAHRACKSAGANRVGSAPGGHGPAAASEDRRHGRK